MQRMDCRELAIPRGPVRAAARARAAVDDDRSVLHVYWDFATKMHLAVGLATALGLVGGLVRPPAPRAAWPITRRATSSRMGAREDYGEKLQEVLRRQGGIAPDVRDACQQYAYVSAAIALTGGGTASFATSGGYPDSERVAAVVAAAQPTLEALLDACVEKAPALVRTPEAVLPVARLALWRPRDTWVRPLDAWDGCDDGASAAAALRGLESHLVEKWEVPSVLHGALGFRGEGRSAGIPEAAHRAAYAFFAAHASAGAGTGSVRDSLQTAIGGGDAAVVSKSVSKAFVATAAPAAAVAADADGGADPLRALRRAQVAAQGGEAWVAEGVCASKMGRSLLGASGLGGGGPAAGGAEGGVGVCEAFGTSAIQWVCTHAAELAEPSEVTLAIDYALEMRRADADYSLAGRTPKTVRAAMDAYALTTVTFDEDELFQPNPRGIKGMFLPNATIPRGTVGARAPSPSRRARSNAGPSPPAKPHRRTPPRLRSEGTVRRAPKRRAGTVPHGPGLAGRARRSAVHRARRRGRLPPPPHLRRQPSGQLPRRPLRLAAQVRDAREAEGLVVLVVHSHVRRRGRARLHLPR